MGRVIVCNLDIKPEVCASFTRGFRNEATFYEIAKNNATGTKPKNTF
jgi:hypothetical protein